MKKSNVSFDNLLNQLSEEKINLVVDRSAIRAGWLVLPPAGDTSGTGGSGSGSNSGSGSSNSGSTADNTAPFGIAI